jgi:hypothetical protein
VQPGLEYYYNVYKPGYAVLNGMVDVPMTDYDMGTITLNELFLPPTGISVEVLEGNNTAVIQWQAPVAKANVKTTAKLKTPAISKDRLLMGYCVWRLEQGMETDTSAWVMIGVAFSDEHSIQDNGWNELAQGIYKYAVKATYPDSQASEAVFSSDVFRYTDGTVSGVVVDLDANAIPGATITLTREVRDGLGPYTATSDENGQFTVNNVWYGEYTLTSTARYFESFSEPSVTVTERHDKQISIMLNDNLISPVNLNATVNQSKSIVSLSWQPPTQSQSRLINGYQIWRFSVNDEQSPQLWTSVSGLLTTQYFQDADWVNLPVGNYKYAIKAVYAGNTYSEASFSNSVKNDFAGLRYNRILSCYPSPFSTSTQLSYAMKVPCNVKMEIFNLQGQLVQTLIKRDNIQGVNFLSWDGTNKQGYRLSSGMYLLRLKANNTISYQKVVLLK